MSILLNAGAGKAHCKLFHYSKEFIFFMHSNESDIGVQSARLSVCGNVSFRCEPAPVSAGPSSLRGCVYSLIGSQQGGPR